MSEAEVVDVVQDVVAPESAEVTEQPQETSEAPKPVEESPQEKNWRSARQKMDEQTRHIQGLETELNNIRASLTPKVVEQEPEFLTETEKKLYHKMKDLEERLEKKTAIDPDAIVERVRSRFSDFESVVTPENLSNLKQNEPELAHSLISLKDDPYKQAIAAYKLIKRSEWYQDGTTMADKQRAIENSKKPVSVQAVRKQGALSDANRFANGLTPELKKSLLKEMSEARKGA